MHELSAKLTFHMQVKEEKKKPKQQNQSDFLRKWERKKTATFLSVWKKNNQL